MKIDLFQKKIISLNWRFAWLSINNIKIGEISKKKSSHYFKGDIPFRNYELVFRKIVESALLIEKSVSKIVSKYHDYDLVTANGKFIQTAIPAE